MSAEVEHRRARSLVTSVNGVLNEDMRQAIALARADGVPAVLSCIGRDGFPRLYVPASIQPRGAEQIVVSMQASDGSVLAAIEADPRVALLCRDPRAETRYQFAGRARPMTEQIASGHAQQDRKGAGGPGASIVIELERVEVTGWEGQGAALTQPAEESPPAPVSQRSTVLEVAGLSIYYGTKRAVHDLSLQVVRGEIFGLLGPNGAGKTSTLSAIEGLLKPRSGVVSLEGSDVLRHPIEARSKLGVQLQTTNFQSSLTIRQIVRLFAGLYGVRMPGPEVNRVIASIGLEAEAGKPFKQLSGGQQQRLALQIAVIHKPVLLLLDEPTAGLDPQARRQLWGRIEGLRQHGGSILLTTHSMEEAQAVCDRVAIMDHGEILTSGPPQELIARHRDDPRVRAVAHGDVTLDDVFVGLTGSEVRD